MKKLPLVLALGAASVCSVASAQSSVQVYGRLYPYVNSEKGSGATPVGTPVSTLSATPSGVNAVGPIKGMAAGNSNLGFKGQEDLGGGLKAIFQLESTIAVDDGNAAAGFSWNRNTFVGMEGGFGTIRLGLMDTVQKEYGDTLGVLNVSSGTPMSSSNILRKIGFGTSSNSRFHERRANSIRWDSAEYGGIAGALQVATNEAPLAGVTTGTGSAKTYSLGLKYDQGPWYFAVAHEIHDNWYGGSSNAPNAMRNLTTAGVKSKDKATQLTVEWRPTKQHKFEFDVIKKTYDENPTVTGRFRSYKNNAYLVAWEARWGEQIRSIIQYVRSDAGSCTRVAAVCNTDGLEGSKLIYGGSYYLARRTYLFGVVDKMTNGKSARFAANDFGNVNPGEDSRHFIAGISHGF
jgi:predicted porin